MDLIWNGDSNKEEDLKFGITPIESLIVDISETKIRQIEFSGSCKKRGLVYNNKMYMLKEARFFRESGKQRLEFIGEYVYWQFCKRLGIPSENMIIINDGKNLLLALELFSFPIKQLTEKDTVMDVKNKYEDKKISVSMTFERAIDIFDRYGIKDEVFIVYLLDAHLNNQDRHFGNLSIMEGSNKFEVKISPLYDNCSSSYIGISDELILRGFSHINVNTVFNRESPSIRVKDKFNGDYIEISQKELINMINEINPDLVYYFYNELVNKCDEKFINSLLDQIKGFVIPERLEFMRLKLITKNRYYRDTYL